ncbi:hypothetical protein JST97_02485 [bacterium]|nr:hypothetical protein [bacterium]
MKIHSHLPFAGLPRPVQTKGLIPFDFNKPEKPDNDEDWGMNPNPDGYKPNFKLMGVCAAGGVCGGISLGILGSSYLGIHPLPLVAAGCLAGAYLGGAIGLAFPDRDSQ